jgi:hypothetical protein
MDLIANAQKDQNCNDKNLNVMVKILMDNLATNRTVYKYHYLFVTMFI